MPRACSSSLGIQDDFHALVDTTEGFDWINERPTATEKKAQVGLLRKAGLRSTCVGPESPQGAARLVGLG